LSFDYCFLAAAMCQFCASSIGGHQQSSTQKMRERAADFPLAFAGCLSVSLIFKRLDQVHIMM
jgi:hypothetical protein